MQGGLAAFWNVRGQSRADALMHGFSDIDLRGLTADQAVDPNNPWDRQADFEAVIKHKLTRGGPLLSIDTVLDVEYTFQRDPDVAWLDAEARAASGTDDQAEFRYLYQKEWAEWHSLPVQWAKEIVPDTKIGIYGVQVFERDYYGLVDSDDETLHEAHKDDLQIWQHIDREIDFYVSSIYIFFDDPGIIYYMAGNVELNYKKSRQYGYRPVYAYSWMRYHSIDPLGPEVAPYLVEAMAIIPFFSGASATVLWGHSTDTEVQPYVNLPRYMEALARVAQLSNLIGKGRLVIDQPASDLWKEQRPLIRYVVVDGQCIVMAVNPWQREYDEMTMRFACEGFEGEVTMCGKRVSLLLVTNAPEITEF